MQNPRPIVRAESTEGALVVAGDAVGLADASGLGLLNTTSPVLYSGTLDTHPKALSSALAGGATLLVTDSNRKQTFLWNTVSDNAGITLAASDPEPSVALNIFPDAPGDAQSTAQMVGVASVTGSPDTPDHSAAQAIDGIPDSAWETQLGVLRHPGTLAPRQVLAGDPGQAGDHGWHHDPAAPSQRLRSQPVDHEGDDQLRRRLPHHRQARPRVRARGADS